MHRLLSVGLLCASMSLAWSSGASAQFVERSGNVFHVRACLGPDIRGMARCHAHIVTDARGNPFERNLTRNATPSGYGPADLHSAYNISATGSSATIVAIVDAYGYTNAEADLGVYRAQYGLPACTTANGCFRKLNQNGVQGNYPKQNTGWAQEAALDLDMVSAMCPNCKIILVEANSASNADLGTAVNTAAAKGAHVISNSYGGPDTAAYDGYYNHPGVAITASSGDSGYGVQSPASSPGVIAVGGTSLFRAANSRGWTETVWSGAGSGCSTLHSKPSWQTDPLCSAGRMEADVSAIADPATGVAVYGPGRRGSSWLVFGGTSVAAPLVGGIFGANGGVLQDYHPNLYGNVASLNDVTSGSNGSCGGTYFCTASSPSNPNGNGGSTYDGPTGLGTPNGTAPF